MSFRKPIKHPEYQIFLDPVFGEDRKILKVKDPNKTIQLSIAVGPILTPEELKALGEWLIEKAELIKNK